MDADLRVAAQLRRQMLGEAPDKRAQAVLALAPFQDPARLAAEGEVGRAREGSGQGPRVHALQREELDHEAQQVAAPRLVEHQIDRRVGGQAAVAQQSRPSISTGANSGRSAHGAARCSGPIRGPRAVSKTTRSPLTTSVAATLSLVSPPFSRSKSSSSGRRSRIGSRS